MGHSLTVGPSVQAVPHRLCGWFKTLEDAGLVTVTDYPQSPTFLESLSGGVGLCRFPSTANVVLTDSLQVHCTQAAQGVILPSVLLNKAQDVLFNLLESGSGWHITLVVYKSFQHPPPPTHQRQKPHTCPAPLSTVLMYRDSVRASCAYVKL